jgi:hypothetical protein
MKIFWGKNNKMAGAKHGIFLICPTKKSKYFRSILKLKKKGCPKIPDSLLIYFIMNF